MAEKLPPDLLKKLRPLEKSLHAAAQAGEVERAIELATEIQALFVGRRKHHRLLRAKLWAFEAALDANRVTYAESGFRGVRQLANAGTRLHLEASSLLAIVLLRQKKIPEAKRLIRDVIRRVNDIQSERTRRQFQKRLVNRLEEECILVELMDTGDGTLDAEEVHQKAVLLIQQNSENEILKLIGNSVPSAGVLLLRDVRDYSIKQLPPPDRKALPAPEQAEQPLPIGKKTFAVLRRIAWKTFCHPDSEIYKLWSNRIPKVFNQGYFAAAITASLNQWRVGVPLLASGITALVMKYSAEEFCEMSKPKGVMIDAKDRQPEKDA